MSMIETGTPVLVTDEVARIRAERVRIVGNDCCHGSDPACAAGCIFAEAVRNIISNVEPEPAPGADTRPSERREHHERRTPDDTGGDVRDALGGGPMNAEKRSKAYNALGQLDGLVTALEARAVWCHHTFGRAALVTHRHVSDAESARKARATLAEALDADEGHAPSSEFLDITVLREVEVEQNGLLGEAELLLEEVVGAFFDGDIGRAAHLAHTAYLKVGEAQDANPTREAIGTLVSLYELLSEALVSLDEMRYARERGV